MYRFRIRTTPHARSVRSILLIHLVSFCFAAHADQEVTKREVTIPWQEVAGATKYQVQVASDPKFEDGVQSLQTVEPHATFQLVPGRYYLRARGTDASGSRGPWSEPKQIRVLPPPPIATAPPDRAKYDVPFLQERGIRLSWKGVKGYPVLLEIKSANRSDGFREVVDIQGDEFWVWRPEGPGRYTWRVAYGGVGESEWSATREIEVGAGAFAEVAPARKLTWEYADPGDQARLAVMVQGLGGVLRGESHDRDHKPNDSETSQVVTGAALEWRARFRRRRLEAWRPSLRVAAIVQKHVFRQRDFWLPRLAIDVEYTRPRVRWRYGPFLHVEGARAGVFLAPIPSSPREATFWRYNIGPGGVGEYHWSDAWSVEGRASPFLSFGGESVNLPHKEVGAALGFESSIAIIYENWKGYLAQVQLRYTQEHVSWQAFEPGTRSTQRNDYAIFGVGIGYKF